MKCFRYLIVILILAACSEAVRMEDLKYMNGYWQIDTVIMPDDSKKTYSVSSTVDFIQFEHNKGYRKKVQPALDGTFDTSDDAIAFEVRQVDDRVILLYSNAGENWEEEVIQIDTASFSVRNEAGITYRYTRYEPVNTEDE